MENLSFGKKIMLLRKHHNLTQKKLAERLRWGLATITRYEADRMDPSASNLIALSNIFNVSIDYLLKDDENLIFDDKELIKITKQIDKLSLKDREFLKNNIRGYLERFSSQ